MEKQMKTNPKNKFQNKSKAKENISKGLTNYRKRVLSSSDEKFLKLEEEKNKS